MKTISYHITRAFMLGASFLLFIYISLFSATVLFTENSSSINHINIVGSYYLGELKAGKINDGKVNPLLSVYSSYSSLPTRVKAQIEPNWLGTINFQSEAFEDDEVTVLALPVEENRIFYAVANSEPTELDELTFLLLEFVLFVTGVALFLIVAYIMMKTSQKIANPIEKLAYDIKQNTGEPYEIKGLVNKELKTMVDALNTYQLQIQTALKREKLFTRYISHEYRTPLTIIKGSLDLLAVNANEKQQRHLIRAQNACIAMSRLTKTILLLARDKSQYSDDTTITCTVDDALIQSIIDDLFQLIEQLNVEITVVEIKPFSVRAESILVASLIANLMSNAIKCSSESKVHINCNSKQLSIIDQGVGLTETPRGVEGFGIGLVLVKDICNRYSWTFTLKSNEFGGCTATVNFVDL